MAWVESDRVNIRLYLGFSALFLQANPRLESAITASQAIVDGGTRPDNSTETLARSIITELQGVDTKLDNLDPLMGGTKVDEAEVDAARETARLCAKGRRYVHRLARIFDTAPIADVFSSAAIGSEFSEAGARRMYG